MWANKSLDGLVTFVDLFARLDSNIHPSAWISHSTLVIAIGTPCDLGATSVVTVTRGHTGIDTVLMVQTHTS